MYFTQVEKIPRRIFRPCKMQRLIEEFEKSDFPCAKVQYEMGEYKNPMSAYTSLRRALIHQGKSGTMGVRMASGDIYLYCREA